jgi:dihydrofolate reductase
MGRVIAGMSVSLDGFINDRDGSVKQLNADFAEFGETPSFKEMIEKTGAAVMGKNTYEMADPFLWANDDYEFQTPVFVLTHTPPEKFPKGNDKLSFTFVTDGVESAISQARKAAGEKDVQIIGGADTIQQCLSEGTCDEFQVDIISILLGGGLRLFENIATDKITLDRTKVEEITSLRTRITFKVSKT